MRESILRASLPHIRAQSFTRQAIRAGLADLPSSSSPASSSSSSSLTGQDSDYVLENTFGKEGTPEKELVRLWEEEGIRNMSVEGQGEASGSESGSRIREVLGRRLRYSEETAGEHIVQVRRTSSPLHYCILVALLIIVKSLVRIFPSQRPAGNRPTQSCNPLPRSPHIYSTSPRRSQR
jgi:hypothetical protein